MKTELPVLTPLAWLTAFVVLLCPPFIPAATAQSVDSWSDNTRGTGFKWETAAEWSLGVTPSLSQTDVMITNRFVGSGIFARTVSIDATTVLSNAINGCMSINNLTLSSPSATLNNNLFVSNTGATPLTIDHSLTISSRGVVSITNSVVIVGTPGGVLSDDGSLLFNTGSLITSNFSFGGGPVSNVFAYVGDTGTGQMTVLDGTWLAAHVIVGHGPGSQGTLTLAGGMTFVNGSFVIGYGPSSAGAVWLTGGQLVESNGAFAADIGFAGVGQMTVSNGTWAPYQVDVGGSQGTLTIAGGTITVQTTLVLGFGPGMVWMTGGQLTAAGISIGGDGQMTVSNGTLQTGAAYVGLNADSGTLTMAGGTNTLSSLLTIGLDSGSTGTVWLTGGQLTTLNDTTYVGQDGVGRMTVSNGNWLAKEVDIGGAGLGRMTIVDGSIMAQSVCVACTTDGAVAELTMTGGSLTVLGNVVIGNCAADGVAFVQISGGSTVYVTNAAHNAVLDVRNGFFLLKGGTLVVDVLVATNGCDSTFDHIGGTLTVGTLVLDPNGDADGDGLPNGWEQAHQLDPLSSIGNNGADGDPDGDGYSNYQEYLAGSDPQNPLSTPLQIFPPPFQITSIARSGNDIILTWLTPGGTTNQVQVTSGGSGGSYATNGFTNLGGQMVIGGSGIVTTNYTDVGGATNKPSRFYRVRLVP